MRVKTEVGDVLEFSADVLISTANPWLNMSGGVNGTIYRQCPSIQDELKEHLSSIGKSAIEAGTVVKTSAGTLPFNHIVHAVAIDPFYDSSEELVTETIVAAFSLASTLNARSISMPTLATGFGPISIESFGAAFVKALEGVRELKIELVTIVVTSTENRDLIVRALKSS